MGKVGEAAGKGTSNNIHNSLYLKSLPTENGKSETKGIRHVKISQKVKNPNIVHFFPCPFPVSPGLIMG